MVLNNNEMDSFKMFKSLQLNGDMGKIAERSNTN